MPAVEPHKPSPLYYIRSLVRPKPQPQPLELLLDENTLDGLGDILPWLDLNPAPAFTRLTSERGQTAPDDPQVIALAKTLRISGYDDIILRVPFGGHRLRCDIVSAERPDLSMMAYRCGKETLFDWNVNDKTYSRKQDVTGVNGSYLPRDEQFDALKALLQLECPLVCGWHEYERAPKV